MLFVKLDQNGFFKFETRINEYCSSRKTFDLTKTIFILIYFNLEICIYKTSTLKVMRTK